MLFHLRSIRLLLLVMGLSLCAPIYSQNACSESDIDVISKRIPRANVSVTDVHYQSTDGVVTVNWSTDPGSGPPNTASIRDVAFLFIPDEGVGDYFASDKKLDEVGGVKFFLTSRMSFSGGGGRQSGTTESIKLDPKLQYHLYSGGYICNPELESKNGLIQWQLFRETDGRPKNIAFKEQSLSIHAIDLSPMTSTGVNPNGDILIDVQLPVNAPVSSGIEIAVSNNDNIIASISSPEIVTNFLNYIARLDAKTASGTIYKNSSGYHWVSLVNRSLISGGQLLCKLRIPVVGKGAFDEAEVGTRYLVSHWALELGDKILAGVGRQKYTGNSSVFVAGLLLEGTWIDQGASLISQISKAYKGNSVDNQLLLSKMLSIQTSWRNMGEMINLPSKLDQEAFVGGYSRIDFDLIADELKNTCDAIDGRYLISWPSNVSIWFLNNNTLSQFAPCEGRCEEIATKNVLDPQHLAFASCENLKSMRDNGLWVRNISDAEWALYSDNSIRTAVDKFYVKIHRVDYSGNLLRTTSASGYSDPRPIISVPRIGFNWFQASQGRPKVDKYITGWAPATDNVFPIGNSVDLKIAVSALMGHAGDPVVSQVSKLRDAPNYTASPNLSIDKQNKWALSLSLQDPPVGPSQFNDNTRYQAMLSVGAINFPQRMLVPIDYYPAHSMSFVMLSGEQNGLSRKENIKVALAAAEYLHYKNHKYVELLDLSKWNFGKVYHQKYGWTLQYRQDMDIATFFNGVPKFLSTESGLKSQKLPYELGLSLGGANSSGLTLEKQQSIKAKLGGFLDSYDFSSQNIQNEFGFTKIDPILWERTATNLGVTNVSMLCWGLEKSDGLSCYAPEWVNKASQSLAFMSFQFALPELSAGYGAYEIQQGNIASGIMDIAPAGLKYAGIGLKAARSSAQTSEYFLKSSQIYDDIAINSEKLAVTSGAMDAPVASASAVLKDVEVFTPGQLAKLNGPEVGIGFVTEKQGVYNAIKGELVLSDAQMYDASAEGALSSILHRKRAVPFVRYLNPNIKGKDFIKFDGISIQDDVVKLIDRKFYKSSTRADPEQLERAFIALDQNCIKVQKCMEVVYEFPNEGARAAAQRLIDRESWGLYLTTKVVAF